MGRHKIWRAEAKKVRRKRIRQKLAQERDTATRIEEEQKAQSPRYQAWLSEQHALELFAEEEEARQAEERNAAWLAEETRAQAVWKERQEKLAHARAERAKQELRIREEWEEEQRKARAAQEEQQRKAEEKQRVQEKLMRQIEDFINKGGDMPPEVNVASVTNPDKPPCPFFTKTGACRFGDRCSRNHIRPGISRVLLVTNFYDYIGLRPMNQEEMESADDWLEYEDSETYQHFLNFYEDVLPEWERIGRVSQFKVCCNLELHLRGNVYVEYESVNDAVRAFKLFSGRWYGGKQMSVEFVTISSWKAAICGQFHKQRCPKGRSCNFLHVFRNPGNAFYTADHDRQVWRKKYRRSVSRSWSRSPSQERSSKRSKHWRWSASPSPPSVRNGNSEHYREDNDRKGKASPRRSVRRERSERRDHGQGRSMRRERKKRERSSERTIHKHKDHEDSKDRSARNSHGSSERYSHSPSHVISTMNVESSLENSSALQSKTHNIDKSVYETSQCSVVQDSIAKGGLAETVKGIYLPSSVDESQVVDLTSLTSHTDNQGCESVDNRTDNKSSKHKKKKKEKKSSHRKEKRRKKRTKVAPDSSPLSRSVSSHSDSD